MKLLKILPVISARKMFVYPPFNNDSHTKKQTAVSEQTHQTSINQ